MFTAMSKVNLASQVAFSFLGKPYKWGGDDPIEGFDCSGLCIEILKSVGILPRKGDWTAQNLWYELFAIYGSCLSKNLREGCLVFWYNNKDRSRIVHVEYAINSHLSIGASGGSSRIKTIENAMKYNAFIKMRPITGRGASGAIGIIYPFAE
jgi:cell wall-associated NlpC family hydrolase